MAKIIDKNGKEATEASALMAYFRQPNQPLSDFYAEVKQLTPESKTELALGAARELGWQVVE